MPVCFFRTINLLFLEPRVILHVVEVWTSGVLIRLQESVSEEVPLDPSKRYSLPLLSSHFASKARYDLYRMYKAFLLLCLQPPKERARTERAKHDTCTYYLAAAASPLKRIIKQFQTVHVVWHYAAHLHGTAFRYVVKQMSSRNMGCRKQRP